MSIPSGVRVPAEATIHFAAPGLGGDTTVCEAAGSKLPAGDLGLVDIGGPLEDQVDCQECLERRHA